MVGFLSRRGEPSQRVRRLTVVASAVAVPLSLWTPMLVIRRLGIDARLELVILLVLVLLLAMPLLVVQEYRRNVFRRKDADERERVRRNEAYAISYRAVQWALIIAPVLVILLYHQLHGLFGGQWFLIYWPLVWYAIFLPYMVFAWREPDVAA